MSNDERTGRTAALFGGRPVMTFRQEVDRRRFLTAAAVIGVGGSLVAATRLDPRAFAQGDTGDLEILNYALTLEYLEADFYTQGVEGGVLSGRELELVTLIRDHEQAHVTALTDTVETLGGTPAELPMFTYPEGTFTDRMMFLEAASMFEELGVDAYHGQIAAVQSAEILGAAAAIAGIESRHAAVLADLVGGDPFPSPFEDNKTMDEVLGLAGSFIQM